MLSLTHASLILCTHSQFRFHVQINIYMLRTHSRSFTYYTDDGYDDDDELDSLFTCTDSRNNNFAISILCNVKINYIYICIFNALTESKSNGKNINNLQLIWSQKELAEYLCPQIYIHYIPMADWEKKMWKC